MKYLNYLVLLIPVPFLFHYYEYEQHLKNQDAPFLFIVFLFFMIISVIASKDIKIIQLFILTIIQTLISLYLASKFIENDTYWFKPFNRDKVVDTTSRK